MRKGFTFLEILVVLGIIGILSALVYPDIINALTTRTLESAARDVIMDLQIAKFQSVKTKLNHRLRFDLDDNDVWRFFLEREEQPTVWSLIPRHIPKTIPAKLNLTLSLPNQEVIFSPLGLVMNFSALQNSISIQSDKLKAFEKPDVRVIRVYAGGSIHFDTEASQ